MTDRRSDFRQKTESMFDGIEQQLKDIAKVAQVKVVTELVIETWGPGKQWPTTEYQAVGRLRAGWRWGSQPPPAMPSNATDGPYDLGHGQQTIGPLSLKIFQEDLQPVTWAWNDVTYAMAVHEGLGGNSKIGRRPWVEIVADRWPELLDAARRDVMSHAP
jgi:hypothetical protein